MDDPQIKELLFLLRQLVLQVRLVAHMLEGPRADEELQDFRTWSNDLCEEVFTIRGDKVS